MAIGFEERLLCEPAAQLSLDSAAVNSHGTLLEGTEHSMDSGYSIKPPVIPKSPKWSLCPVDFESSGLCLGVVS